MRVLLLVTLATGVASARADGLPRWAKWPPEQWSWGGFLGVHDFADESGLGHDGMPIPGSNLANTVPLGGRLTWWMSSQVGIEGELTLLPTSTVDGSADVLGFGYNAHAIATVLDESQRFRPYGVLGVGGLAALSDDTGRFGHGAVAQLLMGLAGEMSLTPAYGTRVDLRFGLGPDIDGSPGAFDVEFLIGFYAHAGRRAHHAHVEVAEAAMPMPAATPAGSTLPPPVASLSPRVEDVDSDGDAVYGSLDRCPREKETPNGYLDDDGCADVLAAGAGEIRGLGTAIQFRAGSSRLTWESRQVLNEVARHLQDHTNLRISIIGHTDDRGDRARNVSLARRRAEAVKVYLVGHGVADARLDFLGMGPDAPIADNATAGGRAQNRRIELKVIW